MTGPLARGVKPQERAGLDAKVERRRPLAIRDAHATPRIPFEFSASAAPRQRRARAPRELHGFFDLSAARGRRGFGHGGALVFQKSTMEIYPDEGFAIFPIRPPAERSSTSFRTCCSISSTRRLIRRRRARRTRKRRVQRSLASIARYALQPIAARRR